MAKPQCGQNMPGGNATICHLACSEVFFFNQLNMRNLISRANSKYVLFCFFFLNTLRDLYSKVYTDGSLKLKKNKLCLYEQTNRCGEGRRTGEAESL